MNQDTINELHDCNLVTQKRKKTLRHCNVRGHPLLLVSQQVCHSLFVVYSQLSLRVNLYWPEHESDNVPT